MNVHESDPALRDSGGVAIAGALESVCSASRAEAVSRPGARKLRTP